MEKDLENPPVLLAITGASGSIFALQLARELNAVGQRFHVIFSKAGEDVTRFELGNEGFHEIIDLAERRYGDQDFFSAPASGSSRWHSMVIIPCTMGTLSAISNGISLNLIHRAADCFLKERRRLVIAVRETPFNRNHLENMLKLHDAGATIYPIIPSFYHKPKDIQDMVRQFVLRIMDFLGILAPNIYRWDSNN